jgi:hypothetical protein
MDFYRFGVERKGLRVKASGKGERKNWWLTTGCGQIARNQRWFQPSAVNHHTGKKYFRLLDRTGEYPIVI